MNLKDLTRGTLTVTNGAGEDAELECILTEDLKQALDKEIERLETKHHNCDRYEHQKEQYCGTCHWTIAQYVKVKEMRDSL